VKFSNSLLYREQGLGLQNHCALHEKGEHRDDLKSGDLPKIVKSAFGKKRVLFIVCRYARAYLLVFMNERTLILESAVLFFC
jgi:hypothetical protein